CFITEKIDGTNAQICFDEHGQILCGSRKRAITPEDDNYGFARWAYENQDALFNILGEGRHYGEWWGAGIQRRYGLDKKMFSLFNSGRWSERDLEEVEQLSVVPVLYHGDFLTEEIDRVMAELKEGGSVASKGFMNPEGIVIFHSASQTLYKRTFDFDETGKPD
ncbi:MAG: RNA ligase family protein, partial [Gammaproteobacteria bacterium]|nr:RNA ligase family protein [Gammaproteobacteria bacterium]